MLTKGNRKFLQSDGSGYHRQTAKDHRDAIKQRVRDSVLDFKLLLEEWPESEREEVFRKLAQDANYREGLASFIALLYMENRFESGMQTLLFDGVNRAEREMAGTDLRMVNVDFEVKASGRVVFEDAIEKFRERRLGDLTDAEAHAIIRLLRSSSAIRPADLDDMREEMVDVFEELMQERAEGTSRRQEYAREKQARYANNEEDK